MECSNCKKTFPQNPKRFSKEDKYKALMMYLNNVGIRKIALFFGVSAPAVLKWIRNAHKLLASEYICNIFPVIFFVFKYIVIALLTPSPMVYAITRFRLLE